MKASTPSVTAPSSHAVSLVNRVNAAFNLPRQTLQAHGFALAPERPRPYRSAGHQEDALIQGTSRTGAAVMVALISSAPVALQAGFADWPQLWGPRGHGRHGRAAPGRRPSCASCGAGRSGAASPRVSGGGERGYTGESDGKSDHAIAFDVGPAARCGGPRSARPIAATTARVTVPSRRPRWAAAACSWPARTALLVALDAASGRELWRKDLAAELQAEAAVLRLRRLADRRRRPGRAAGRRRREERARRVRRGERTPRLGGPRSSGDQGRLGRLHDGGARYDRRASASSW